MAEGKSKKSKPKAAPAIAFPDATKSPAAKLKASAAKMKATPAMTKAGLSVVGVLEVVQDVIEALERNSDKAQSLLANTIRLVNAVVDKDLFEIIDALQDGTKDATEIAADLRDIFEL